MMWACIATSAGWAVAVVSLGLFALVVESVGRMARENEESEGAKPVPSLARKLLGLAMLVPFSVGLGSCAVEDRVCEMAEREAGAR